MNNIFETIYCWLDSFFGISLEQYLQGFSCATQGYTSANQFNLYGGVALGLAAFVMILYYYIINHPRQNRWWIWMLYGLAVGIINFIVAAWKTIYDLNNGLIDDCLVNMRDSSGYIIGQLITTTDCIGFAVVNLLWSMVFYAILSVLFKWFSTNCKHSPF